MPDVNITIPTPLIVPPAKFKTRYRELPSGIFSANVDRNNTTFTLTGLSSGNYELEVIYVNEDGQECDITLWPFEVKEDFTCISFSGEIVSGSPVPYKLRITYPTPVTSNPPCGWEVAYLQPPFTNYVVIPYSTLPTSGVIEFPIASNNGLLLRIRALMCNGEYKECAFTDVPPIVPPPCVPAGVPTYTIREVFNTGLGKCEYFVDVSFTQSNPVSNTVQFSYLQSSSSPIAVDQFNGTINVGAGPLVTFTKKLNPSFKAGQECTAYTFNVIDRCNNGVAQQIDYCRSICFHETP